MELADCLAGREQLIPFKIMKCFDRATGKDPYFLGPNLGKKPGVRAA